MFQNKKAVSPLIATVLLVMIVVSIGAAVMVVIQGLTEEQIESTKTQSQLLKCANDVQVGIFTQGEDYLICMDDPATSTDLGNFSIYLENKGIKDILDWRITVFGVNGLADINGGFSALDQGEIKLYKFNFTGSGSITKVRLSPKTAVQGGTGTVTCEEPNLIWDEDFVARLEDCDDVAWDDKNPDP